MIDAFIKTTDVAVLGCQNGNILSSKMFSKVKTISDKVHKHLFGLENCTEYQLLLEKNDLWDNNVSSYLTTNIQNCITCSASSPPKLNRKVSISSLSKKLNEIVFIESFHLDYVRIIHCVELVSRISTIKVVESTTMKDYIVALDASCISKIFHPESIHAGKVFQGG